VVELKGAEADSDVHSLDRLQNPQILLLYVSWACLRYTTTTQQYVEYMTGR